MHMKKIASVIEMGETHQEGFMHRALEEGNCWHSILCELKEDEQMRD